MNTKDLVMKLHEEGYKRVYVWQDRPNASYPDHTHPTDTTHVILDGEMTLTMGNEKKTFTSGQRSSIPAGAVHSALIGPTGCRYLIGEK